MAKHQVIEAVRQAAHHLTGAHDDYDPLLELIGDARFVLLAKPVTALMSFTASAGKLPNG